MINIKKYKHILCMIFLVSFLFSFSTACQPKTELPVNEREYSIKLNKQEMEPVSRLLLGFNVVYAHESDITWGEGKIEGYLKEVNASVIRYPGGTVTTFYHWNSLTGEGWKDSWDPDNPVTPKPGTEFMDLDEFIAMAQRTGVTPLLGINMSSGRRWQRGEDGIQEAINLMKYCRDKNFMVKYWYLDNEPYQPDGNGGSKTIEEYAGMVNQYAIRMKEIDPDIKIIINWKASFKNRRDDYKKLLEIAGANINVIDVHWYWNWENTTFENWLAKTPMALWTGDSYISEIAYFRQMVNDFGYPDIKLASLEWNAGPVKENNVNPYQCAFIQTEMLMQFITGGLDISAFWPLQWPSDEVTTRSFVRRSDRGVQPVFHTFKFLGKIQGDNVIKSEVITNQAHILDLVTINNDESTVRLCILNKNSDAIKINVNSDLFNNLKLTEAAAFVYDGKAGNLENLNLTGQNNEGISFTAPGTSIVMLTFTRI